MLNALCVRVYEQIFSAVYFLCFQRFDLKLSHFPKKTVRIYKRHGLFQNFEYFLF